MTNKTFVKLSVWLIPILLGFAQTAYSQTDSLSFVSWVLYGTPGHIDVSGDYLYISAMAFVIVDISDETNPEVVSHLRPLEPGSPGS